MGPSNTPNPNHSNRLEVSELAKILDLSPSCTEQTLVHLKCYLAAMPDGTDKVEAFSQLGVALAVVGRVDEALAVREAIDISSPRNNDEFSHGTNALVQITGACAAALYGAGQEKRADLLIEQCSVGLRQLPPPSKDLYNSSSISYVEALAEMMRPFIALGISAPIEKLEVKLRDALGTELPSSGISRDDLDSFWSPCEASFLLRGDAQGLFSHLRDLGTTPGVSSKELGELYNHLLELAYQTEVDHFGDDVLEWALAVNENIQNKDVRATQFHKIVQTLFEAEQFALAKETLLFREDALFSPGTLGVNDNNAILLAIRTIEGDEKEVSQMVAQFLNERDLDEREATGAYALYQLYWQAAQNSFDIDQGAAGKALAHKAVGYLLTKGMDDGNNWQLEGNLMVSAIDKGLVDVAVDSDMIHYDRSYALDLVNHLVGNDQARTLALAIIAKELAKDYSVSSLEKAQSIFETLTVKLPADFPRPKDVSLGQEFELKANWLADACLANMRYASVALELNDRAGLSRALKGCLAVFDELEGLCKHNGWAGDEDHDWQVECHNELDVTASNLIEFAGEKGLSGFLDVVVHRATAFFSPVYQRLDEGYDVEEEDDDDDDDDRNNMAQDLATQLPGGVPESEEKLLREEDSPWEDLPQGDLTRAIRKAIGQIFLSTSHLHRQDNELVAPDDEYVERLLGDGCS